MTFCHGPGCTREATATEFFCGEDCAVKWDRQWFTEHGGDLVLDKATRPAPGRIPPFLAPAVERSLPEFQRQFVAAMDAVTAQVNTVLNDISPMDDLNRAIESLPSTEPVEPVNLTREQRDGLMAMYPQRDGRYYVSGTLGDLIGAPIELVDTVGESTLSRLPANTGAANPQVASENPQVEQGQPGWLGRAFGRLFGKGAT